MQTQYLAGQSSSPVGFEAFESQPPAIRPIPYQFRVDSTIVTGDCTQAIQTSKVGQVKGIALSLPFGSDRRNKCRTVSNAFLCSVSPPLWQRAVSKKNRNTLWLNQSRSRSSLCPPENTAENTKTLTRLTTTGQANRPVQHASLTTFNQFGGQA